MQSAEIAIRPWERGDFGLLAAAAPALSARTLRLRFWGAVPTLPASYLASTAARWPLRWDAVVAVEGARLVGWAEYGRQPDEPAAADLAVCVIDAEQGHGIGTALLGAVLDRARRAGLARVHVDIAPTNAPAQQVWHTVTGGRAATVALAGGVAGGVAARVAQNRASWAVSGRGTSLGSRGRW